MEIKTITSRKILASQGDYTPEVTIGFSDGSWSVASVPAGISAGKFEVKKVEADEAIKEIGEIGEICRDKDWTQEKLDELLKQKIEEGFGGNATLAVSAAFYKSRIPNPKPKTYPKLMLLIFEGGEHGNKNLSIQEFLVIENNFESAARDYRTVKEQLEEKNIEHLVGAEGGFSPINFTNEMALEVIKNVLPRKQIALDVAGCFASGVPLDFNLLTSQFPVVSIEDPFDDEVWDKWVEFNDRHLSLVIGDDLTTTNPERIRKAIDLKACGGIVIKPNQIGTITLAKEAIRVAREGGLKIIVSHRGQETDDFWIADFAVDVEADFVKFGGMCRGERVAKYNRLIELGP